MERVKNPFLVKGYKGTELFCDREQETQQLIDNAQNGLNTTLFSIRRMGKTGLIHHVFHVLEQEKDWKCIYVDIYATQNIEEFTNQLATAILKSFPPSKVKKFLEILKRFSPIITYDPFTGAPEVTFAFAQRAHYEFSLRGLFDYLDQQDTPVLIAFDEFQQIANYPQTNTEALLRTIIQSLEHVNFIFSGSHKHLLIEMFNSTKRPFFSSTQPLSLESISAARYRTFIQSQFSKYKKSIDEESIDFILEWTRRHTYYTQALCNKVFTISGRKATIQTIHLACDTILKEQAPIFFQYRNLLTTQQWSLLKAIGRAQTVSQPTGFEFISHYSLGNPSSVKRSLEALVEKEMVYSFLDENGHKNYQVYDCFLSRWLER